MKKILLAFSIIFSVLCGCAKSNPVKPPPFPAAFSSTIRVVHDELEVKAKITFSSPESCRIELLSPDELMGMSIGFSDESCKIDYKGLTLNANTIPQTAFAKILVELAAKTQSQLAANPEYKKESDEWHYRAQTSDMHYLITQDAKQGCIKYISVPSLDLTVEFSEFTLPE